MTGLQAVCPRPHSAVSVMVSLSASSSSRSSGLPSWAMIRSSVSSMRFVPSRQGVHLPQLSFWVKCMKNRATSTMQVSSSMTTSPPEPMMAPSFFSESKSMG